MEPIDEQQQPLVGTEPGEVEPPLVDGVTRLVVPSGDLRFVEVDHLVVAVAASEIGFDDLAAWFAERLVRE
jgi:hypothetical protein